MTTERIQKVLAREGVGSRREVERMIIDGRITQSGKPVSVGHPVSPGDVLKIDNKTFTVPDSEAQEQHVLLYHKPEGEICTVYDEMDRPTVFDELPECPEGRWISVGRLDLNTSGLLLFTNDGTLANQLMHPSSEIEREYAVRVFGEVTDEMLDQLREGVMLEDGPAHFDSLQVGDGKGRNHWYYVTLKEGRKREVRRLWEAVGVQVSRLIRIRYGDILLPRALPAGEYEYLTEKDIRRLYHAIKRKKKARKIADEPEEPT